MNIHELKAIVTAQREREHRQNKFAAALKGIDLDKGTRSSAQQKFDEIKDRVALKQMGGELKKEQAEARALGFDFEIEE